MQKISLLSTACLHLLRITLQKARRASSKPLRIVFTSPLHTLPSQRRHQAPPLAPSLLLGQSIGLGTDCYSPTAPARPMTTMYLSTKTTFSWLLLDSGLIYSEILQKLLRAHTNTIQSPITEPSMDSFILGWGTVRQGLAWNSACKLGWPETLGPLGSFKLPDSSVAFQFLGK